MLLVNGVNYHSPCRVGVLTLIYLMPKTTVNVNNLTMNNAIAAVVYCNPQSILVSLSINTDACRSKITGLSY